jgi:hypothetical protein
MKENKYKVKVIVDSSVGVVMHGSCACPAGNGGKCNHIAVLLFYLLDYSVYRQSGCSCGRGLLPFIIGAVVGYM